MQSKDVAKMYVEGVSLYAGTYVDDGAETIAEAFVKVRNN